MSVFWKQFIVASAGLFLLVIGGGWEVAAGAFLFMWGHNIEFRHERKK